MCCIFWFCMPSYQSSIALMKFKTEQQNSRNIRSVPQMNPVVCPSPIMHTIAIKDQFTKWLIHVIVLGLTEGGMYDKNGAHSFSPNDGGTVAREPPCGCSFAMSTNKGREAISQSQTWKIFKKKNFFLCLCVCVQTRKIKHRNVEEHAKIRMALTEKW